MFENYYEVGALDIIKRNYGEKATEDGKFFLSNYTLIKCGSMVFETFF